MQIVRISAEVETVMMWPQIRLLLTAKEKVNSMWNNLKLYGQGAGTVNYHVKCMRNDKAAEFDEQVLVAHKHDH